MKLPLYLYYLFVVHNTAAVSFVPISVSEGPNAKRLDRFWTSTGLSPPGSGITAQKFLTSKDELINLSLIGSLPYSAITHIRIHWLFDLITFNNVTGSSNTNSNQLSYLNFTLLDEVIRNLHQFRIHPGFELMGYPRIGLKTAVNFNWEQLISIFLERYIKLYGFEEVKNWRFETWNEPDLKEYNILNFTLFDYLNYVRGSLTALNRYNLTLGGPAGLFKSTHSHKFCWSFLDYCNSSSCNLNFLSFHKKGNSDVKTIIDETKSFLEVIASNYSRLEGVPFANTEADFLSGWWRNFSWRGDVRYAASVCESVIAHSQLAFSKGVKLAFISHDNAFINFFPYFFNQRTLTARFQMNNTAVPHSQFFRKPAMNALTLLALLEEFSIPVKPPENKNLKIIATRTENLTSAGSRISILIVYNKAMKIGPKKLFHLSVRHPGVKNTKYCILAIKNDSPHPSSVWKYFDAPVFPKKLLRFQMRLSEETHVERIADVPENTILNISLQMSLPSVALIHFCTKTNNLPGVVENLHCLNITFNEVLLTWSDKNVASKCLKTYEVEFYPGFCSRAVNFFRINSQDTLFLSYQHVMLTANLSLQELVRGCYRVRAIDYWNRPGRYSNQIEYL